ncbi:Putative transcriptional regulator, TetR [Mycobacteroides abscessus subsp. abscessus]|uniref:TetR/AcrR family transcriptional regulator n=1 Tax=Mycobacteroides abscessus TaxID=36809 RepID=UPI000929C375|nr:TetR family transcriptional regulator [Mycobacteroides abscessus]MDM2350379.1 TetR family transcriptional regulator [Mycobacteroides abscessus]MDM2360940.1 TetR family transcriptional regulator [Mycobacteroides abscessus]SIM05474.1 Putative transcriptional regulator, TetR [Mycobacteroides abscessus subsp. abscessus]SIN57394.1 Putative transcriptional regulator, TetR [Mycobacteroides abscessus subsp. abscessus]
MDTVVAVSGGRRGQAIDAAIELLASGGERAVTYGRVDKAAGIPHGTCCNRFRYMDDLLKAVCVEIERRRAAEWAKLLNPVTSGSDVAADELAAILARYVSDSCNANSVTGKLARAHHALMVIAQHRPVLHLSLAEENREHVRLLREALRRMKASASHLDAVLVSKYLTGAVAEQLAIPDAGLAPQADITALLAALT